MNLPEMQDLQITILFDILEAFENSSTNDPEASFHLLKNLSLLLDTIQDKVNLPIDFYLKGIQTFNVLSYKSSTAVRLRIKETNLIEIRNVFVIKCLLENLEMSDDIYNKVLTVLNIHKLVDNLLASSDTKV